MTRFTKLLREGWSGKPGAHWARTCKDSLTRKPGHPNKVDWLQGHAPRMFLFFAEQRRLEGRKDFYISSIVKHCRY